MFCPYCKLARVENEAPCQNCGAPSPLLQRVQQGAWGSAAAANWDASVASPVAPNIASQVQWDQVPQLTFEAPGQQQGWGQPPAQGAYPTQFSPAQYSPAQQPMQQQAQQYWSQVEEASPAWGQPAQQQGWGQPAQYSPVQQPSPPVQQQNQYWSQVEEPAWPSPTQLAQANMGQQQSLLPVPYENPMGGQLAAPQYTVPLQLVPEQAIEHLLPVEYADGESVYVPPMYTKPRAIIPRYRVISGLLSFIIVTLLLCGGVGYYANTSGLISRILNGGTPPNVTLAQAPLPDPPTQADKDRGPAYNIIPSATTASRVDANNFAVQEVKAFKPGQVFYLTFSVHAPNNDGTVYAKWYTDQKFFITVPTNKPIKAGATQNGDMSMVYKQPAEGMVELYWSSQNKDQLAQRVYFVVRP